MNSGQQKVWTVFSITHWSDIPRKDMLMFDWTYIQLNGNRIWQSKKEASFLPTSWLRYSFVKKDLNNFNIFNNNKRQEKSEYHKILDVILAVSFLMQPRCIWPSSIPGLSVDLLSFLSNETPKSVYAKLLPRQSGTILNWCLGLSLS